MSEAADEPWSDPAVPDEPLFPKGENDGENVIERYGPGEGDVIVWDTTSNYARIRQMRLEGKTVPEIAAALELKPSTVKQSLTNQIKAESAQIDGEEMATILQLEMDRLDHMLQGYWCSAKNGDLDSAKYILAISRERREWLKWAQPEPTGDIGIVNNILVVGGTESEFLATLETARARLEADHGQPVVDADVVEDETDG